MSDPLACGRQSPWSSSSLSLILFLLSSTLSLKLQFLSDGVGPAPAPDSALALLLKVVNGRRVMKFATEQLDELVLISEQVTRLPSAEQAADGRR